MTKKQLVTLAQAIFVVLAFLIAGTMDYNDAKMMEEYKQSIQAGK